MEGDEEVTSSIEHADAIVGIAKTIETCKLESGGFSPDTYRRGAYARWFAENSQPGQWPTVAETLMSQAERIVRLHKPKGDGLPETIVYGCESEGLEYVAVKKRHSGCVFTMTPDEQTATAAYIQRCLAPPVRRILAAFEVVEPSTEVINAQMTALFDKHGNNICRLVPRGER